MIAVGGPSDDTPETPQARLREWFLLDGHRHEVMAVTVVGLFGAFTTFTLSGLVPLRSAQPLYYVFGGLISGNLTVITVVVAINQLLLSRELYTPNELTTEIEGVTDYRHDVGDTVGQVPPAEPLGFLRLLVESARGEAQSLGGLSRSEGGEELRDELDPIVSELTAKADRVDGLLEQSEPSTFEVLSTTLATNYATEVEDLRRVESQFGHRLPEDVHASLETLVHHLKNIDVARQYFKTVYLQEELDALSRQLFYVGLASLALVSAGLLLLTGAPDAPVPRSAFNVVVPAVITAGFAPISLLFAYILRIATVSERTAAIMPFTTPAQEK